MDAVTTGPLADVRLTRDQMEELRYAALLHDFGKVAVEEKYLKKDKKLYATELIGLRQRFAYISKANEADYLRAQLESCERVATLRSSCRHSRPSTCQRKAEIERALAIVLAGERADRHRRRRGRLPRDREAPEPAIRRPREEERFPVELGAGPFLTEDEVEALTIRKGSLTRREREKINEHVTHTYEFLRKIPWTSEFRRIPEIAHAHHEKLNGTGYPRRLQARDIPPESRMMTIADIYDALVAIDRPYKVPISNERALSILESDMRRGDLDSEMLKVFLEVKPYELPAFRELLRS